MNHFLKLRGILISITFLFCGILLIFRGLIPSSAMRSVRSKIRNLKVDVHMDKRGNNIYAIVFDIAAWNTKYGIPLGSDFTVKDEDFYLSLDSTALYTITVDPTVTSTFEGVYLSISSILLNEKKIFEASKISLIISGAFLLILSVLIFYFAFFKKRKISSHYK